MAEEKEKAAGATNTNGLMTPATKRPNEKKSDEIIPQYVAPVKDNSRRKLLTEPQFIELAHKWHENKISIKEAAAILNISWSTFQKNVQILLGKKHSKMKPPKRAESICVSLKSAAEYQERKRRGPRPKEEPQPHYINPYYRPKEKETCYNCKKEYTPEPMRYSHFYKDARRYFCSWSCKCRWLRSMGIDF